MNEITAEDLGIAEVVEQESELKRRHSSPDSRSPILFHTH
jgi:hypothetical protein